MKGGVLKYKHELSVYFILKIYLKNINVGSKFVLQMYFKFLSQNANSIAISNNKEEHEKNPKPEKEMVRI